MPPTAAVVVPTRGRPDYLAVALAGIVPQGREAGAEVIVVEDGGTGARAVAEAAGARWIGLSPARGPNAARNAGIAASDAPLVVFTEDDVDAPPGWLWTLLRAATAEPAADVLGGPIRGRVEAPWRACGREWPPISSFDRGVRDRDVDLVYAGNMLIRRTALDRVGPFAESLGLYGPAQDARRVAAARTGSAPAAGFYGDEEEWQERLRAAGGRIRYVAAARLDHRRAGADARLPALTRAAFGRGRVARRWAASRGRAPTPGAEARVLAGAVAHAARHRCANGVLWAATAAGRIAEAATDLPKGRDARGQTPPAHFGGVRPPSGSAADSFLAPGSGLLLGRRAIVRAAAQDALLDLAAAARGEPGRLRRATARAARRRVLVLGVERTDVPNLLPAARAELLRSHHEVELHVTPAGERGKFENLDRLLADHPAEGHDWLIVLDDDVALPRGFLDAFLLVAERLDLALAQPAHRRRSHAAWPVMRRRPVLARETRFVEIGPVTAFAARTFTTLLPFPPLRMGWGLDAHWGAVAAARGWRCGVVDATPIRHGLRATGSGYGHGEAVAEARAFLAERPYVTRAEASRALAVHRAWPPHRPPPAARPAARAAPGAPAAPAAPAAAAAPGSAPRRPDTAPPA